MKEFTDAMKRSILSENPLFVSVLGLSGAVVFTRDIASALTATVTALLVLAASTAAMYIFEHFAGTTGAKVVFFSTAVAMTAICGAAAETLLPAVWEEIGACYPLFAVGSLALTASGRHGEGIVSREIGTLALVAGYGAAIIVVAAVRQIFGGLPLMATSGGALIIIGIAAAALHAVLSRFSGDGEKAGTADDNSADDEVLPDDDFSVAVPDAEGVTDEHE